MFIFSFFFAIIDSILFVNTKMLKYCTNIINNKMLTVFKQFLRFIIFYNLYSLKNINFSQTTKSWLENRPVIDNIQFENF